MSDFHVDRSMGSASTVIVAVMMFAACAGQARGEAAPADGRQPLNQRVFRSCFGVNTHFWQGQPLEEIALVQDIGHASSQINLVVVDSITRLVSFSTSRNIMGFFSTMRSLCGKGKCVIIVANSYAFDDNLAARVGDISETHLK